MPDSIAEHILSFYRQALTLKLLPRTGWLQRGVAMPESIAAHSYGVALLALMVGDAIEGIDRSRLLALALLHDVAEIQLTDLPASASMFLGKAAKHEAERAAFEALVAELPGRDSYRELWSEYAEGASAEARLVKGLDRIELLVQALAYEQAGNRGLDEFWRAAGVGWDEFPLLGELASALLARRQEKL